MNLNIYEAGSLLKFSHKVNEFITQTFDRPELGFLMELAECSPG